MRTKKAILSTTYSIGQASLGLLLHPYQTMQDLVESGVFIWLSLLPFGLWMVGGGLWMVGNRLFFQTLPFIGLWIFALLWFSLFLLLWQILLLYLLVRFWQAFSIRT